MNNLRIAELQISKLFGEINYNIVLPEQKPVAIIIAPNGRGKTTILNLLAFIFEPSYDAYKAIYSIPFDCFRCVLSNGKIVELKKIDSHFADKEQSSERNAAVHDPRSKARSLLFEKNDFAFTIFVGKKSVYGPLTFSQAFAEAGHVDPIEYIDDDDIEDYSAYRSSHSTSLYRQRYVWYLQKKALQEFECAIPVSYIKADRIQPVMISPSRFSDMDEPKQISPLKKASDKIGESITNATNRYYNAVSHAKDELPKMFLYDKGCELDVSDFWAGWISYRNELLAYHSIGLINPTEDFIDRKTLEERWNDKKDFLRIYLEAFRNTIDPLRDIHRRLSLLKTILDERNSITRKQVSFSKNGISFSVDGSEIPLDTLSSGEKHDFILFYNLILGGATDGLVLIDEPEISLHIEWQETFLDHLVEISRLNGIKAIIATHSPNIVSSHYDFLVDKGET